MVLCMALLEKRYYSSLVAHSLLSSWLHGNLRRQVTGQTVHGDVISALHMLKGEF